MNNSRVWLRNVFVIAIIVAVSILVLEVGLRVAFPEKAKLLSTRIWDHSDAYLPKHSVGTHYFLDTKTHAKFDESGFRKIGNNCMRDEAQKILIVGDSNIAALFLEDGDDLGSQLARDLNDGGCYSVKLFGVAGFGPDQSYLALEKFVSKEHFDYVVFHMFADNDAGDLVRDSHEMAITELVPGPGYCYLEPHWLDDYLLPKALRKAIFITSGLYINWNRVRHSLGNDDICGAVFDTPGDTPLQSLFARATIDKRLLHEGKMQIFMADRYDVEFACRTEPELLDFVNSKLRAIARGYMKLSSEYAFEPMFLIEPSEYDVTNNHPEISESILEQCENYKNDNLVEIYTQSFDQTAEIINLYDKFLGCSECYFSKQELGDDNHWNATGVAIAAAEIAKRIRR